MSKESRNALRGFDSDVLALWKRLEAYPPTGSPGSERWFDNGPLERLMIERQEGDIFGTIAEQFVHDMRRIRVPDVVIRNTDSGSIASIKAYAATSLPARWDHFLGLDIARDPSGKVVTCQVNFRPLEWHSELERMIPGERAEVVSLEEATQQVDRAPDRMIALSGLVRAFSNVLM